MLAGLDDLRLPALSSAEENQAVQSLHTEAQQRFSDELLDIVREMFQSVRLGKSLGRHRGCRPVPGGGSGWMVCYKKDLEPMTTASVEPLFVDATPGDIHLRVVGGDYDDRIDLDFHFAVFGAQTVDGEEVEEWNGFSFWIVSSPADHSQLVLRIRSGHAMVRAALGTLLRVFIDQGGNLLLGGTRRRYKGHIRELLLEVETLETPRLVDSLEADLHLPDDVKQLVAAVNNEVGDKVAVKAYRVFGRHIGNHEQRIRIKYQGLLEVDWAKVTNGPAHYRVLWGHVGGPSA
jgi:hypothetical protein